MLRFSQINTGKSTRFSSNQFAFGANLIAQLIDAFSCVFSRAINWRFPNFLSRNRRNYLRPLIPELDTLRTRTLDRLDTLEYLR